MKKILILTAAAVLTLQTVQAAENPMEQDAYKIVLSKPLQKKEDIISEGDIFASGLVAVVSGIMSIYYFDKIKEINNYNTRNNASWSTLKPKLSLLFWGSFFIVDCFQIYEKINTRTKQLKNYKEQKKILKESRFRNAR